MTQQRWLCSHCNTFNSVHASKCAWCGAENVNDSKNHAPEPNRDCEIYINEIYNKIKDLPASSLSLLCTITEYVDTNDNSKRPSHVLIDTVVNDVISKSEENDILAMIDFYLDFVNDPNT